MSNKVMLIFKKSLLYLLGIIFILVIVYLRVLKVRLPVQIDFSFNWIIFSIGCSTIVLCLINIYRQFPKSSGELIISKTIRAIIAKIQAYIYKPLFMIFEVIEKREIVRNLLYQISIRIIHFEFYTHYTYFFIIFLPKIVVALTFFIDVCIYNYMYYFYKALFLLLLPLILRVLLYMLSTWAIHCKKELEQYIYVETEKAIPISNGYNCTVTYKWRSPKNTDENIQAYIDYYEMCVRILIIHAAIKIEESKLLFRYGVVCINILFIIGWFYIIYFMFHS